MIEPVGLIAAAGLEQLLAQVITTILTFVLVVVTLKVFFWKTVLETIDQRKAQVTNQFEEIDAKLVDARNLQSNYESKLAKINDEAREIQNKHIADAKEVALAIENKAKVEAEAIIEKAKSDLTIELEKARIEIRREAVELTLLATGKLLNHEMNQDRQRELVQSFISELQVAKSAERGA